MNTLSRTLCAALMVLATPSVASPTDDHSQQEEAIRLFDGEGLDHFYTFLKDRGRDADPLGVFTVTDGLLRISGEEWGCITTRDVYENYHLVAEFKWGDKTWGNRAHAARDSGILLHSVGEDGAYGGVWMHAIECQMIEGGTGDFIVVGDGSEAFSITSPVSETLQGKSHVFQPDGKPVTIHEGRINWFGRAPEWQDVRGFRGARDVERPVGEWNRLECIARDGEITVILNGVTVNRCFDARPSKGRIQVQSEGAEVFFRRLDLYPLKSAEPRPRFIYNSDADNMFIYKDPPMSPADVHRYVDEIADTGATTLYISPNIGMTVNFPGQVSEMLGTHVSPAIAATLTDPAATRPASLERAAVNLKSLVDAGHDPLGLIIARAHEKGMEAFVSFRLNEVHAVEQADSMLLSRFWKEHPEWRVGRMGDGPTELQTAILGPRTSPIVAGWLWGGLNFAIPEVRAQRLAELREICERYPIDGLDLDFQRFPVYFRKGEESVNVSTMTEWMREVHAMVRDVGAARNHPIVLSARIMARPEQNLGLGLDPVAWAREGLIDIVVVSHYLRNDFPLPIGEYRALLPADTPIYGSIEVEPSADTYRSIASQLRKDGADGIMLFNFFTTRESGKEPPFEVAKEIGAMCVPGPNKPVLLVVNKHEDTMSYVDPDSLTILGQVTTGHDPHELVITPDRRYAYISNYAPPGDSISVIDLVKREHILQIPTGQYTRIHSAAITPDGKFTYFTAGQTGYVVEVDTATNTVTRGIPTHGKISHMVVVSPDGTKLYTANIETQNVSIIDRLSGDLVTQIPCDKGCEGLTFTPDGKQLWAANQDAGTISIIDLAEHKVVETLPCPGVPLRIAFTSDGRLALVSNWVEKGEVVVFDVASRVERKRLPVGNQPIGVLVTPDDTRAFVTSMTSDEVHVIDLESLTVAHRFVTGKGSDAMAWWNPPDGH